MTHPFDIAAFQQRVNRRTFLSRAGLGLGSVALASLLPAHLRAAATVSAANTSRGVINPTHFPVKAKRIIHLCMAGGPSHLETFDPKPELARINGQPFPESFTKGQQLAQLQNMQLIARGSFVKFQRYGKCGHEISDLLPRLGSVADDLCIVRSMVTEQI